MSSSAFKGIVGYHEATKHHYERFARSSGYMDWQNQPNPFRFYEDAPVIDLPLLETDPPGNHMGLYLRRHQGTSITLKHVSGMLELSLGLSAWKAVGGNRWALRINPSSGNLHPTEAHLMLPAMDQLPAGIYHYNPFGHALEQRAQAPRHLLVDLAEHLGAEGFMIALSSIYWREAWKYGERAFRYCHHDVGHALAALSIAANLWGWRLTLLSGLADRDIEFMLGFDRTAWHLREEEHADLVCWVHRHEDREVQRHLPKSLVAHFQRLRFDGRPNRLSRQQVSWDIIEQVAMITRKPATPPSTTIFSTRAMLTSPRAAIGAAAIIRKRRSAVAFTRQRALDKTQMLSMLDKTLPRSDCAPFDVQLASPALHLLLFVHDVEGLAPGLYFLVRNRHDWPALREATTDAFAWTPVVDDFPLYLLAPGNFRRQATKVSCYQDIAGEGAFAVGMIARFRATIEKAPHRYRQLFWEAGMIGQVLYLEAEAFGLNGTGIGCYFDDPVHSLLGLEGNTFQSMYHFTVGTAVLDQRLKTYPPYSHLQKHHPSS